MQRLLLGRNNVCRGTIFKVTVHRPQLTVDGNCEIDSQECCWLEALFSELELECVFLNLTEWSGMAVKV